MEVQHLIGTLPGLLPVSFTVVVLLIFYSLQKYLTRKNRGPLPPGPRGWPFFGYIQYVLAEKPIELMLQLRKKYGNIFGFHVGNRYCVVLSNYKSVREGFTNKNNLDRPPMYMRMSSKHKNFNELNGAEWIEHRAFVVNYLKAMGIGRQDFENSVLDELSRVKVKMEQSSGIPDCNIRDIISGSVNNLLFKLVCGRWFEDDHPFMKHFSHFQILLVESFSNNMPQIFFPWIDWFMSRFQRHARATMKAAAAIEKFVRLELANREKVHSGNSDQDYIDMFLSEQKRRLRTSSETTFTNDNLVFNSLVLMLAGTDTVRNTMEWLLMAMAKFPEIQRKVHEEMDSVLGRERAPQYSDKDSLPYTWAVILESIRWKTLLPLNVLHLAREDTFIQGYFIPKDTIVISNLYYCHMDPDYWQSPEEFLPERFLSIDKSRIIVPEYFIPFSIGKRDCPGDKMANISLFLYFTSLMQKFKFSPPEGGVDFLASHRLNLQARKPIIKVDLR